MVNYKEPVHDVTHAHSLIIFCTMESKANWRNKTKEKHLLAKQSQDFEVIQHVFREPHFDVLETPFQQWHVLLKIIVKCIHWLYCRQQKNSNSSYFAFMMLHEISGYLVWHHLGVLHDFQVWEELHKDLAVFETFASEICLHLIKYNLEQHFLISNIWIAVEF